MPFDYSIDFSRIDFRKHPERYQIGRGEQGVLLVQPYKSELLPHWRFRTPIEARKSADALYRLFKEYGRAGDFVGMDIARKYLQMGFTRSRRYANHKSGRKYSKKTGKKIAAQARHAKGFSGKDILCQMAPSSPGQEIPTSEGCASETPKKSGQEFCLTMRSPLTGERIANIACRNDPAKKERAHAPASPPLNRAADC
jgi:hypothetical protein